MRFLLFLLVVVFIAATLTPTYTQSVSVVLTSLDSAKMGGLYNFQFVIKDSTKLRQLLGGHNLEIDFEPLWYVTGTSHNFHGIYGRTITVFDRTTGKELTQYSTSFSPNPFSLSGSFSEYDSVFTGDTASHTIANHDIHTRTTSFTSLNQPTGVPYILDAVELRFDYTLQQWGGEFRADTAYIESGNAGTPVRVSSKRYLTERDTAQSDWTFRSFNNGPGIYEVEFLEGGTELLKDIQWDVHVPRSADFTVHYLNIRVRNVVSCARPDGTKISYPEPLSHAEIPCAFDGAGLFDCDIREIPIHSYNLTAYGWIDGRQSDKFTERPKQTANLNSGAPVLGMDSVQGRYYLSGTGTTSDQVSHTIDFVHVLAVSGLQFGFDFPNKYAKTTKGGINIWPKAGSYTPSEDFKPGDRVIFTSFGGALGFPLPGAKLTVHIDTTTITGVSEISDQSSLTLQFSPSSGSIEYTLPQSGSVVVKLYNIMGQEIETVWAGRQEVGYHMLLVKNALRNGLYYCQLHAGNHVRTALCMQAR